MRKHLLFFWATSFVLFLLAVAVSCSNDPGLDSVPRVQVASDPLRADGAGQEINLAIQSNAYWNVSFSDDQGNVIRWINSDVVSGMGDATIKLTVARNKSMLERIVNILIVTDGRSEGTTIRLTQAPGGGGGSGYDFPMGDLFEIDVNLALSNGFIEGNSCYLDNGLVITRTGTGDAKLTFLCPSHTDKKSYQRALVADNWSEGCAWQLKVPLKDALSGDLRIAFGSRRDNSTGSNPWKFEWSADGNSWTVFDKKLVAGGSDALWKFIDFTIPQASAIPAGGTLWLRMAPSDPANIGNASNPTTLLFQHGLTIFPAKATASALAPQDDKTVVFSHGFDELCDEANSPLITPPMGFLNTCYGGAYSIPTTHTGQVTVATTFTRPGFVQVSSSTKAGTYAVSMKRFEEMNISRCDLTVRFKAAGFLGAEAPSVGDVTVKTDTKSGATVDEDGKVGPLETNSFKEVSVTVRNATPETVLTFTNVATEPRFFIDDLIIEVSGTPERPSPSDPVKASLKEVRAMKGTGSVTISENLYMLGRVVSVNNLPANTLALTDGEQGILVCSANHGLVVGDQAKVILKGAALAVDANGLLVLTVSKAADLSKTSAPVETPTAKPITVAELKAGTYEGMYVSLPASQVVTADLQKTMSGTIALELADQTTYTMKTFATAAFASQSVPKKSGVVKGVAGKDCLLPTSMTDLSAMTAARFGEGVYAITPISEFFLADPTKSDPVEAVYGSTFVAATKTVTFTSGNTIQLLGGDGGTCYSTMLDDKRINGRFVASGWGGDNWASSAVVVKFKATSELKGKLRFGFGVLASSAKTPKTWSVAWSVDNVTWSSDTQVAKTPYGESDFAATFDLLSSSPFKMTRFTIPEAKTIPVGSYLYLRIAPTSNESRDGGVVDGAQPVNFAHGVYLATDEPRAYNTTELPTEANVVLAEGFDELIHGHDYFLPSRHFLSNLHLAYTGKNGWAGASATTECPGYVMLGASTNPKNGKLTSPALTALGDTPTNITVKFKLAFFVPANYNTEPRTLVVKAEGGGAVSGALDFSNVPAITGATISQMEATDALYYKWYDYSIQVTGATKNTKIVFETTSGRNFIDDVVILKD